MIKRNKEFKITYRTDKGFHTIKGTKSLIWALENVYHREILRIKKAV